MECGEDVCIVYEDYRCCQECEEKEDCAEVCGHEFEDGCDSAEEGV
jgi:hypothetical protein